MVIILINSVENGAKVTSVLCSKDLINYLKRSPCAAIQIERDS